jgi:hypothetical protein
VYPSGTDGWRHKKQARNPIISTNVVSIRIIPLLRSTSRQRDQVDILPNKVLTTSTQHKSQGPSYTLDHLEQIGASTRKQAKNPTFQHKHSRQKMWSSHKKVMHKIQLALVQNNQQPAFPHQQVQECTKISPPERNGVSSANGKTSRSTRTRTYWQLHLA